MFFFKFVLFVLGIFTLTFSILLTADAWKSQEELIRDKDDKTVVVSFLTMCWALSIGIIALLIYIST